MIDNDSKDLHVHYAAANGLSSACANMKFNNSALEMS